MLDKIFVGGLDPSVTNEDLRQPFSQYGETFYVKIHVGKGCGFVQFANSQEVIMEICGMEATTEDTYMMVVTDTYYTQACMQQWQQLTEPTLCTAISNTCRFV
uniref:RRM domain-containing protein n=1 Tax=Chenopodium quinoa TaxID=63459 RepID=A0A803N9H8_CHEQI